MVPTIPRGIPGPSGSGQKGGRGSGKWAERGGGGGGGDRWNVKFVKIVKKRASDNENCARKNVFRARITIGTFEKKHAKLPCLCFLYC